MSSLNKIRILSSYLVQKISAGEVIAQPASVVRELIDNSIDADASIISIFIEKGGLQSIQIQDNGRGMSPDDLSLAYLPHSTSKLYTEKDLDHIKTLGFRGEALASIGVCAQLIIKSGMRENNIYTVEVEEGVLKSKQLTSGMKGTTVWVKDLFYKFPAKKRFLRANSYEFKKINDIFLEKALAFPHIAFHLWHNHKFLVQYDPSISYLDRFLDILHYQKKKEQFREFRITRELYTIHFVVGIPPVSHHSRDKIFVVINNRLIKHYSLKNILIHAFSPYLAGGIYPVVAIFLQIDPYYVDFNIHPEKKEVVIKNYSDIYQTIIHSLRQFFDKEDSLNRINPLNIPEEADPHNQYQLFSYNEEEAVNNLEPQLKEMPHNVISEYEHNSIRFLGQLMNVFILFEYKNTLYIVDQHAAHESILYQQLINKQYSIQKLMIPIEFQLDSDEEDLLLNKNLPHYLDLGIEIHFDAQSRIFSILALPESSVKMSHELVEWIKKNDFDITVQLAKKLYADLSCRMAVKQGEILPNHFVMYLIKELLKNPKLPHCPHGRPVFVRLEKKDLFTALKRIV